MYSICSQLTEQRAQRRYINVLWQTTNINALRYNYIISDNSNCSLGSNLNSPERQIVGLLTNSSAKFLMLCHLKFLWFPDKRWKQLVRWIQKRNSKSEQENCILQQAKSEPYGWNFTLLLFKLYSKDATYVMWFRENSRAKPFAIHK